MTNWSEEISRLNKSQRRFLELHAFHAPHRWAWSGKNYEEMTSQSAKLVANSDTKQATISRVDLDGLRKFWLDDSFPVVNPEAIEALR